MFDEFSRSSYGVRGVNKERRKQKTIQTLRYLNQTAIRLKSSMILLYNTLTSLTVV